MYKEVKLSFSASFYVGINIHKYLRIYFTKLRLSSHKFLVERGRWVKSKVPYSERCTLCNNPDVQDEFHITLCCDKFNSLREKYIVDMGARRNFPRGGQTFGGGAPKKSVKGGPHIFFRQALKYAYRGGGVVLMPAEFFSRGPQIY